MTDIIVFENASIDGVIQDPTGEEGLDAVDWRADLTEADREAWKELILADALEADALLLGRGGYEFFAQRYPGRSGAMAEQMNSLPKYVVSSTLAEPKWHGTTVLAGDPLTEIEQLKRRIDGQIRVYASARLVSLLLANDLVDELRLAVFPELMGAGTAALRPERRGETVAPQAITPRRRAGSSARGAAHHPPAGRRTVMARPPSATASA